MACSSPRLELKVSGFGFPFLKRKGTPEDDLYDGVDGVDFESADAYAARSLARMEKRYNNTRPARQFILQVQNLAQQTIGRGNKNVLSSRPWPPSPRLGMEEDDAYEYIRNRWIDQGIWRPEWKDTPDPNGRWLHECMKPKSMFVANGAPGCGPQMYMETPKKRDERLQRMMQVDASRPYYQFLHQVTVEREYLQARKDALESVRSDEYLTYFLALEREGFPPCDEEEEFADINSLAYKFVKEDWIKWDIWDPSWSVLPGMTWRHEMPLEKYLERETGDSFLSMLASSEKVNNEWEPAKAKETASKKKAAKTTAAPKTPKAPKAAKTPKETKTKAAKPASRPVRQTRQLARQASATPEPEAVAAPAPSPAPTRARKAAAKPKATAPESQGRRVSSRLQAKRSAPTSEDEEYEEPKPKRTRRQAK